MTSAGQEPRLAVRNATEADLPAIVGLLADDALGAFRERDQDDGMAAYRRAFADIQAQSGNRFLVAELDGRVVGCLQLIVLPGLSHHGARRAHIESVRIDSRLRGQGLGAQLTEAALAIAADEGCRIAQLTTDRQRADAHRFYERMGFAFSHLGMKRKIGD